MRITQTNEGVNYIEPPKEGSVHVVTFAEEGFSFFKAYCEFAAGLPLPQAVALCTRINDADETGTLAPQWTLTAMPKRFFRGQEWDEAGFRRCLQDAFIANRDHCRSSHIVFQFSCVELHTGRYFGEISQMATAKFADGLIEQITVHVDEVS